MGIQTKRNDDRIVVAVYVCVDTEETLDKLAHGCLEVLWEVDAYSNIIRARPRSDWKWGIPILEGKTCSLSILDCTQPMRCSMYSGAGIFVGRLYFP